MTPEESQFLQDYASNGVAKDWVDLRDTLYKPSLGTLAASFSPKSLLFAESYKNKQLCRALKFGVRQQGRSGRCVGYALAALVDVQRRLQNGDLSELPIDECASAEMLYHMARFHDQYTRLNEDDGANGDPALDSAVTLESRKTGVRSLRSVVKGFYHHGVFTNTLDQHELAWDSKRTIPSVKHAKAARSISLGAYFRVQPVLNHYHAALSDTGTILVSASIHEGWLPRSVAEAQGSIKWKGQVGEGTQHAFVIVGYTNTGFLVLNSWGPEWGGYDGYPGIALWSYSDWARNVIDGWVLRLGVSAPNAFDVSIGEQGLANAYGTIRAGSTPCLELMGHYIHVDDGYYTEMSAYPSNREMIDETLRLLPESVRLGSHGKESDLSKPIADSLSPCKGVLLWISGSLEGMKASFEAAVKRKRIAYAEELYPFFVFWCNDFVEDSIYFLRDKFSDSAKISGQNAEHRDRLIENSVRGTGRAFWREVENCARRGIWDTMDPEVSETLRGRKRGHLGLFFTDLYRKLKAFDCEIHVVVDGAGALVLDELIRMFLKLDGVEPLALANRISTLNLTLPAIEMDLARERIFPLIKLVNQKAVEITPQQPDGTPPESWMPAARIHIPSKAIERRVSNGDYRKSILHLISNAFEDRMDHRNGHGRSTGGPGGQAKTMLGMSKAHDEWKTYAESERGVVDPFFELDSIAGINDPTSNIDQIYLTRDLGMEAEIMRSIHHYASQHRSR